MQTVGPATHRIASHKQRGQTRTCSSKRRRRSSLTQPPFSSSKIPHIPGNDEINALEAQERAWQWYPLTAGPREACQRRTTSNGDELSNVFRSYTYPSCDRFPTLGFDGQRLNAFEKNLAVDQFLYEQSAPSIKSVLSGRFLA